MSVDKKTLIGTVDLTPTWEQQARDCIEIIKDHEHRSIEVVKAATDEIIRMGTLLDQRQGSTPPILDPHNILALEHGTQDDYFKDDTERWCKVDVIGSQYEQETSNRGNWRYRRIYNRSSIRGDWTNGRAPDVK